MSIAENLAKINGLIRQYAKARKVQLLAVSKTKPIEAILQAHKAGQCAFGENYVQEGVEKITFCQEQGIELEWHFIGPLQSNKTKLVAEYFDWCQTVSREKIAQRLNDQRHPYQAPLNVLIQINISDEESKSGIRASDVWPLAEFILRQPRLKLRGLMAIPKATDNVLEQQEAFKQMHELFIALQKAFPQAPIDTLSMGMSDDMQTAIDQGSTMVRIGSAIFGARDYA